MIGIKRNGFTLAEILVSLLILALIATFAIPKILLSQQKEQYKSISKEAASAVGEAYVRYQQLNGSATAGTTFGVITPYLNYLYVQTTGSIDSKQTQGSLLCEAITPCLKLHNGAILRYNGLDFGGTATTNAWEFFVDPNGTDSGTTDGPDKSADFFLYINGRLSSRGSIEPNTVVSTTVFATPDPTKDPPWFNW